MSIWDTYPNLSGPELRLLVAVTTQVLLESERGESEFSPDLLQQSPSANARELQPLLREVAPDLTREQVQQALEDEELATRASLTVLDQVRDQPELAQRVASLYEARQQKMTGVELMLLAGALVIVAMRIKQIKWGAEGGSIDFEPAGEAVKVFVAGLAKGIGVQQ